jgi:hypothetical protein
MKAHGIEHQLSSNSPEKMWRSARRTQELRHNNSFDRIGISWPFIENLAVPQMFPAALIRALARYHLANKLGVPLLHKRLKVDRA